MHLATLLLTLLALFAGADPNTATSDTGSGLEPDGRS
jgi:hypothetical protein